MPNKNVGTTNQEDTIMNNNDSISRTALLSVLESREMTQEEMIELVRGAAPLEVDSVHNSNVQGDGYQYGQPGLLTYLASKGYPVLPDHMG